jgi:hypothetical protein
MQVQKYIIISEKSGCRQKHYGRFLNTLKGSWKPLAEMEKMLNE